MNVQPKTESGTDDLVIIPVSANAFVTQNDNTVSEISVTENGIKNWDSSRSIWSLYFRLNIPDEISIQLRLQACKNNEFKICIKQNITDEVLRKNVLIENSEGKEFQIVFIGTAQIRKSGYICIDFQGIQKATECFATVSHLILTHKIPTNKVTFNLEEDSYFGRRGPSVHLWYNFRDAVEYFYNEVTVPESYDNIGLFAMATGFSGGYFGMQVNSKNERRILFSIWSEYISDDPHQVPEDYKVTPLAIGPDVHIGEFGSEGCGAQSYLLFPWKDGLTYQFLLHGRPLNLNSTTYTAWFKSSEETSWRLIASFKKPQFSSYLTGLHSFLENFDPDQGFLERKALFGNQMVRIFNGRWYNLLSADFTGDATSRKGRLDFAGGVCQIRDDEQGFYLRHCGFFSQFVPTGQRFFRQSKNCFGSDDCFSFITNFIAQKLRKLSSPVMNLLCGFSRYLFYFKDKRRI